MRDVTLVILNSLRIKCHIRRLLMNVCMYDGYVAEDPLTQFNFCN